LTAECLDAAAAGFRAKAAIHPAQVPTINAIFPKVSELLRDAEMIVAAFEQQPGAWTVDMAGCSYDHVQLLAAQRALLLAEKAHSMPRALPFSDTFVIDPL
jgi:citrate lyase subunit beta/citryl-CoA lyase